MNQDEKWLPVEGFDGYQVSSHGRVSIHNPSGQWLSEPAVLKKQSSLQRVYHKVVLRRDNKSHTRQVHRLVLEAFVGPCPDWHRVRHIDGDWHNDRLDNLEWAPLKFFAEALKRRKAKLAGS